MSKKKNIPTSASLGDVRLVLNDDATDADEIQALQNEVNILRHQLDVSLANEGAYKMEINWLETTQKWMAQQLLSANQDSALLDYMEKNHISVYYDVDREGTRTWNASASGTESHGYCIRVASGVPGSMRAVLKARFFGDSKGGA